MTSPSSSCDILKYDIHILRTWRDCVNIEGLVRFKPLLVVITLILASLVLVKIPEGASAQTPHDPIYINGNENFTAANGVTGGSGTPSDPYIIWDWEIDDPSAHGIDIRNTDAHFIIRGVYIHIGRGADYDGIYLHNVTNGRIENSIISNNGNGGISVYYSINVSIIGTTVSNNEGGIWIYSSRNVTITDNDITLSGWAGIILQSSTGVRVYHNSFICNAWHAKDVDGNHNTWDDGYPNGGNYWSDYDGVDQFTGPNQDQPGADGIGDTPYVIDSNNQDNYPLMRDDVSISCPTPWPLSLFYVALTVLIICIVVVVALALYLLFKRKREKPVGSELPEKGTEPQEQRT